MPFRSGHLHLAASYLFRHRAQLAKFGSVGFLTFGINFSAFHLFYGSLGIGYIFAATLAYPIAVISHFLLHRFYTFGAKDQSLAGNLSKYLVMLATNYLVTMTVIWIAVEIVGQSPHFGVIASTATAACLNFMMMKYFVFKLKG
jgi:putative flippase GtrA